MVSWPTKSMLKWELFDADRGTDLADEVRSYFIPDFSNWMDHDSYKKAFEKLLKNLKAGTERCLSGNRLAGGVAGSWAGRAAFKETHKQAEG